MIEFKYVAGALACKLIGITAYRFVIYGRDVLAVRSLHDKIRRWLSSKFPPLPRMF